VLAAVGVADAPELWTELGFEPSRPGATRIGTVDFELRGPEAGKGLLDWTLTGVDAPPGPLGLDGLATTVVDAPPDGQPGAHANGVTALDHVVVTTPDLERTVAALGRVGIHERRRREAGRPGGTSMVQVFFRLGAVILELVGPGGEPPAEGGPARLWGLAFNVSDLETTAAHLGPRLRAVTAAVQPGRFIATLDRDAGSSVEIAFMST